MDGRPDVAQRASRASRRDPPRFAALAGATSNDDIEPQASRFVWLDNLRVALIAGVIVAHVASTYVIDSDWYYMERTADPVTQLVVGVVVLVGGLFGMGLLFLVAGLLTPSAFERKGPTRFARDRAVRLGIPLVIFVCAIDPLTDYIGHDGMGEATSLGQYMHVWLARDADAGPAWFIAELLVFSVVYAVVRGVRPAKHGSPEPFVPVRLVAVGGFIAAGSFFIRISWPFMSETFFGLNLWELPQMIGMFTLGVLAAESGWNGRPLPKSRMATLVRVAAVSLVAVVSFAVVAASASDAAPLLGGLDVRALPLPLIEAAWAISMSLVTLEYFRRRAARTNASLTAVSVASYDAYLVHPPVIVLLAVVMRTSSVPIEAKFVLVSMFGVPLAFAIGWIVAQARRNPQCRAARFTVTFTGKAAAMTDEIRPGPYAEQKVGPPDEDGRPQPQEAEVESARLLANDARDALRVRGLDDEEIRRLADEYVALDLGQDTDAFILWAVDHRQDAR